MPGTLQTILVHVMLFQFLGRGLALDGATHNLLLDSNSSLLGLSNEALIVSEFIIAGTFQKVTD